MLEQGYQDYLKRVFADRMRRNPSYSLRSFARDLGIAPSRLSEVFSGKKGLSPKSARKITSRLGLQADEAAEFHLRVEAQHGRSPIRRQVARERLLATNSSTEASVQNLSLDLFQVIADWQHYAILELTSVKGFRSDYHWIAEQLGISKIDVELAVARLKKLQMLEERDGKLVAVDERTASPSGIPSEAIRKHHRQVLELASRSVDFTPVEERDLSAMTLAVDSTQMPKVREILKRYRRELAELLSSSEQKDRVYTLSIQFFPITKGTL